MTALELVTELFPCPAAPIVAVLSLGLSFWYGLRHPKEFR